VIDTPRFLSLDAVLRRSDAVVSTETGGRTSLMDVGTGRYFSLEDVGARIFAVLESPRSLRDLHEQLVREFDVDVPVCEAELRAFVNTLLACGLLEVVDM